MYVRKQLRRQHRHYFYVARTPKAVEPDVEGEVVAGTEYEAWFKLVDAGLKPVFVEHIAIIDLRRKFPHDSWKTSGRNRVDFF